MFVQTTGLINEFQLQNRELVVNQKGPPKKFINPISLNVPLAITGYGPETLTLTLDDHYDIDWLKLDDNRILIAGCAKNLQVSIYDSTATNNKVPWKKSEAFDLNSAYINVKIMKSSDLSTPSKFYFVASYRNALKYFIKIYQTIGFIDTPLQQKFEL